MTTAPAMTPPECRDLVERCATRWHSTLITSPVLDTATGLLGAWSAAAADIGANPTSFRGREWIAQLADVAVQVAVDQAREPRPPQTSEAAVALLDTLVARLADRGIATTRRVLVVRIPRTDRTPTAVPLALTVDPDHGWSLALDQMHSSPVCFIHGRIDDIDAVLDAVLAVNDGRRRNPFAR
ncbi:hypothetical protein ACFVVM_33020 [Nocardia sp. NPDC058176]|uniref:hypothetical protein n=1 Tax=Nocardia sp. NPDC058176 TaxID=3346368 RepID=UPI0036DA868E